MPFGKIVKEDCNEPFFEWIERYLLPDLFSIHNEKKNDET